MVRFVFFVLALMSAAVSWSAPQVIRADSPNKTSGATVAFKISDTADSEAIPVSGFCVVRYQQASGDDAALYAITNQSTAASSGTLLKSFTSSTSPSNPAYTFTASTRWVKAKATDATAGGSVMTIECNPLVGSTGGGGGSFDACRSGSTQGGGYSSTDGRWAWTCGNYNWHGYQDPSNAETDSFTVDCTGDGTGLLADGTSAGAHAYSCLRDSETRYIGYGLHRIALAAQYTRDGGRVFLPEGLYVDNGAGLDAAGAVTDFPKPYDPEWEARTDFASLGYPTQLRVIQLNRGVRLLGEGIPKAITFDPSDTTVTIHRPKLSGTWVVDDRGAYDANSVTNTLGGLNGNTEPPDFYRILVGGNQYASYCETTSNTDPRCLTNSTSDIPENAQDVPNGANVWGAEFSMLANYATTSGTVCVPDTDSSLGTTQSDAIGTCSLNRQIRCWDDDDADEPRSTGGCNFGAGGSFGACEAPYEALVTDYVTNSQDLQLAMLINECPDNATSSSDCGTPNGVELYVQDFRNAPGAVFTGGSCAAGAGSTVTLGVAQSSATDFSGSIPFPNFYIGGTGATNRLFPVRRGSMDGKGAGFENIGRMPANWLTRDSATNAADCLSGGDIDDTDDETQCDTDTLSGFSMSYNNLIGPNNLFFKASSGIQKGSIVETYPSGGPNDFVGNTIDTSYRHTLVDWGDGNFSYNKIRNLGAWTTAYQVFACFSGDCIFDSNEITNSAISIGFIGYTSAQSLTARNNKFRNVSVNNYLHQVNSIKNYSVDGDRIYGSWFSNYALVSPGAVSVQKPTVTFRNVRGLLDILGTASNATTGGGIPVTFFLFEGDDTADSRPDDWKSVLIDDVTLQTTTSDACLAWFEADNRGSSGASADSASLAREAASRVIIQNSNVIGPGAPAVACQGAYEYTASVFDSNSPSSNTNWAAVRYNPALLNNKVNNVTVANMLGSVSVADVPDADTLPDGTVVRLHDAAATTCTHVSGVLSSGTAVATCISDETTSGTWTEF